MYRRPGQQLRRRLEVLSHAANARSAGISIIVPTLNEEAGIVAALFPLRALRERGAEIILVDGGSIDCTLERARPHADLIIHTGPGRALQMNVGAAVARNQVLLFLHADTQLPEDADRAILSSMAAGARWGRFDVRLSGARFGLRVIESTMNWRSRWFRIATGDQAIFVARAVFDDVGGYPPIALMEDLALSRKLAQQAAPYCLREHVVSSSRRWETRGIARTVLLMWRLRLAYFLGADPRRLAEIYGRSNASESG